jgi:hypothetical protein
MFYRCTFFFAWCSASPHVFFLFCAYNVCGYQVPYFFNTLTNSGQRGVPDGAFPLETTAVGPGGGGGGEGTGGSIEEGGGGIGQGGEGGGAAGVAGVAAAAAESAPAAAVPIAVGDEVQVCSKTSLLPLPFSLFSLHLYLPKCCGGTYFCTIS